MRIFPLMCVMSGVSNSRHSMLIGAVVTKWLTMFARRISQFMFKLTSMSLFSIVDRCFKLEFANSLLSMLSRRFDICLCNTYICALVSALLCSRMFYSSTTVVGGVCIRTFMPFSTVFNEISAFSANFSINRFVSFSFVT